MAAAGGEEPVNLEEKVVEQAEEITKLREVLSIIGSGEGDLREAKILELFKKVRTLIASPRQNERTNRMLNMQLERERTRNNNTKKAMAVIQHELLNAQKMKPQDDSSIRQGLEYWVDKFHRANKKLEIVQASESILEKQIQRLHYVLQREVGDHIPIQKVIEEGTGWVGRSEQISKLRAGMLEGRINVVTSMGNVHAVQDKVAELKAQVAALQPAPLEGYNTIQNDERRTVEILHRNELERMDGERRLQYDKLVHDFLTLRASWGMQKKRLDGVIARRNILEKELRGAKTKMQILLTKSINDDMLIQALTIELAAARQANGPPFPKPGGPLQLDHHARCHKLAASFHELKSQCHEQEMTLKCQGEIIQTFQDTIEDPSCGDWCTSALYQESHKSETKFAPNEDRDPNDDGTKDPPYFLEALLEQFD